jgi:hypothetical protein
METNSTPSADAVPGEEAARIAEVPDAVVAATAIEPAAEATEREVLEAEPAPSHRWTALIPTILFGTLMFVLGGVGGFVGRPYIISPTPTQSAAQQQQAKMQALLEMLVSKTRHFKGNVNAPVTLLEFGDFQ